MVEAGQLDEASGDEFDKIVQPLNDDARSLLISAHAVLVGSASEVELRLATRRASEAPREESQAGETAPFVDAHSAPMVGEVTDWGIDSGDDDQEELVAGRQ